MNVVCYAERVKIRVLKELLECTFIQKLAHSSVAPALMCAILFSKENDAALEKVKSLVRSVEVRTGHHEWKARAEPPAQGDLQSISAQMSGCESRLASITRKSRFAAQVHQFILCRGEDHQDAEEQELITSTVRTLQQRAEMQEIDMEFVRNRVRTQKDAVS